MRKYVDLHPLFYYNTIHVKISIMPVVYPDVQAGSRRRYIASKEAVRRDHRMPKRTVRGLCRPGIGRLTERTTAHRSVPCAPNAEGVEKMLRKPSRPFVCVHRICEARCSFRSDQDWRRGSKQGIATNVHDKPLPMMTAYRVLGWDIQDFPNAYEYYHNLITLPLHIMLSDEDVKYECDVLKTVIEEIRG